MKDVQDYVKEKHEKEISYKRLVFLSSAQSVPEMSNNDWENSLQTPSSDECFYDIGERSVPNDSILTDDLQLNWSAFTPKQTKKENIHQKVRNCLYHMNQPELNFCFAFFQTR